MTTELFYGRVLDFKRFLLVSTLSMSFLSCGSLGKKEEEPKVVEFNSVVSQCMDEIKQETPDILDSDTDIKTIDAKLECALEALEMFEKNVKMSNIDGYTVDDIFGFTSTFIFKNKKISRELINLIFKIKTALVGGQDSLLTIKEIHTIVDMAKTLKAHVIPMIPILRSCKRKTPNQDLKEIIDKIDGFGNSFSNYLTSHPTVSLSWPNLRKLIEDFATLYKKELSKTWLDRVPKIKQMVFGGKPLEFETDFLTKAAFYFGKAGGPALAAYCIRDDLEKKQIINNTSHRENLMIIARSFKKAIDQSLQWNNEHFLLTDIDELIDYIPDSVLKDFKDIPRTTIKNTLRPLIGRFLKPNIDGSVDLKTINTLFNLVEEWHERQSHLEHIFKTYNLDGSGVTTVEFTNAAEAYLKTLANPNNYQVKKLIWISRAFRPYFLNDQNYVSFTGAKKHSLHNFLLIHSFRMVSELFIKNYGKFPLEQKAEFNDLSQLIKDFKEIAAALKVLDPTVPNSDRRHFNNMNLFTQSSNGDSFVDVNEVTSYLPLILSAKTVSKKALDIISPLCKTEFLDPVGWNWMDPRCFRIAYSARIDSLWSTFPELKIAYNSLDSNERKTMRESIEKGARLYGMTQEPVGMYDSDAISMLLHYIESLFTRFDRDGNQILDLEETLNAFPLFKLKLAEFGGIDPTDEDMLTAAFTYTVKFGAPPDKNDVTSLAHFIWWKLQKPFWSLSASRDSVFKIISIISKPEPLPRD